MSEPLKYSKLKKAFKWVAIGGAVYASLYVLEQIARVTELKWLTLVIALQALILHIPSKEGRQVLSAMLWLGVVVPVLMALTGVHPYQY